MLTKSHTDEVAYRSYKKIYTAILKKAQILHYEKLFDSKNNSIKKLWSNLNRLCSNSKKSSAITSIDKITNDAGLHITSPLDISNCLNDYFCNIENNLLNGVPASFKHFSQYLNKPLTNSIYVVEVTSTEILNFISSLKCNKSSGPDDFSIRLLKENAFLLCEPLRYIYNLSLFSGVVPDRLKIAKVVPIFKKGATTNKCKYRPISLLSVFNKLLEKAVYSRL